MTIWPMRIACWIPKAINIYSEYVILNAFHYNNVWTNALQYYVTPKLSALLKPYL